MKRPAPPPDAARELLTGVVERVTYHNEESGFAVLRVKVRGHLDLVTVVGHVAAVSPGEHVHVSGAWTLDREHGRQFRAAHVTCAAPDTPDAIEKYLASGLLKGIGPHFARKLVDAFGAAVFDVVEQTPGRLREVPGIGPMRAERIAAGWAEQRSVRDVMLFLHANGVGTSRAVRIHRTYGADAIARITENPYILARDIRGIGFLTADRIAQRLGVEKTAPMRLGAGLAFVLAEALGRGHCGLPRAELEETATRVLEAPRERVVTALETELRVGSVVLAPVEGEPCVFLAPLARAEEAIASRIRRLAANRPPWPAFDVDKALGWVEGRLGMTLAPSQREALRTAVSSPVVVITGGPGVGKTTLLNAILRVLVAKQVRAVLCAPTGRAAKRLSEATGLTAKTIHRLLEVDPRTGRFRRDERSPLECDLVVLDEASMVDVPLMQSLTAALPPAAALFVVGDADQLPSVGPGQVLADLIACGRVPVVRLTEVFRQASESRIVVAAHRINHGEMPSFGAGQPASDFFFIEVREPEEGVRRVVELVRERIPRRFGLHAVRDIQVLCPMNRGALGARALNLELQRALNPSGAPAIERFGQRFAAGDKVMQVENDYDKEVYNGDVGVVTAIDEDAETLDVEFDGRSVVFDFGDLDRLVLAYATTIHKSQGSEYPAVVVPVTTQHYMMLKRNLVYTAVTRGRKLVVLVGQARALAIAVKAGVEERRWSRLRKLLQETGNTGVRKF